MNEKAWENFILKNQVSKDIPDEIVMSWKRSVRAGIQPELKKAPQIFNPHDIQKIASTNLLHHIFSQLSGEMDKYFNKYDCSLSLSDEKGCIIASFVEGTLKEKLQEVRFYEGGHWHESKSGTNAIGTALTTDKEIVVKGPEHFCQNWHPFSCAGIPIRHPMSQKTAGILDLTTLKERFPENALSLTAVFVQSIEALWHATLLQDIEFIRQEFNKYIKSIEHDHVIAVDSSGNIVDTCMKGPYREKEQPVNVKLDQLEKGIYEGDIQLENGAAAEGRVIPVKRNNRTIGGVIHLRKGNRSKTFKQEKTNEDSFSSYSCMIGNSESWQQVIAGAKRVASRNMSVLITGKSGTGKELMARAIHESSARKNNAFLAVNCAGLNHELAASELFGYAPGAFTGALKTGKKGWFEAADGGTLFLDEISEMPPSIQAMMLRVIQEKQVLRIGEHTPRSVDVRIIAASNRNLKEWIQAGKFRADLYFRLNVGRIHLPCLCERNGDIELLAEHFLKNIDGHFQIDQSAWEVFNQYSWPGNVRELQNVLEYAALYARDEIITASDLPADLFEHENNKKYTIRLVPDKKDKQINEGESEEDDLLKTIKACRYNMTQASKALGISRSTLYRKMKKYEINI
ncbi:sigma-54-dependent Fis family transcriptional regulator [Alteribacillus bidgolensis]|uniref:Transcriptional regulator of acetoin/glycerol metabolism n=1 Tax=Alteribacillus bidgolensis TaxID=930129 RepID=A0A1G8KWM0_9BACI|nr:sigma-54-dependent Fis family transcriptional regulator [Alteribacillus bidgolensis]SDI47779.1 Transcriptional regulator of acetoin/glycerol metabolism [Alteribacillus bidgolensis]